MIKESIPVEGIPKDVNKAQWKAILHAGSHLLIVAGPGTGKTHTLVHRMAHISGQLERGQKILAVTFTNKAAREMSQRLAGLLDHHSGKVTAGTFHHFCLSILRQYGSRIAQGENFQIATEPDIHSAAKELWAEESFSFRKNILEEISSWKSVRFREPMPGNVRRYQERLRKDNLLDFDDLLLETLNLLTADTSVLRDVQKTFRFIFVDEYQDINPLQHALLKTLVAPGIYLTAIGDPNQAIYGFRGSDVRFFESFAQDFQGASVFFLQENYRSASNLLKASGQVIEKSGFPDIPPLTAQIYQEGRLLIHEASTDKAEAEYVVHQIEKLVGGTSMFSRDSGRVDNAGEARRSFGDVAVLYRLNSQRRILQEAFERSGIPFQVSGDKPLIAQPVISKIVKMIMRERSRLSRPGKGSGIVEALRSVRDWADYREILKENPDAEENFSRLIHFAGAFTSFDEFIDYVFLQRSDDLLEEKAEKVSLLTLHAAKGLEFPAVFIIGCEQGLLPLRLDGFETNIDEERRLFYVGMTRAEEQLFLIRARRRRLYGRVYQNSPSTFIFDIEERLKLLDKPEPLRSRGKGKGIRQEKQLSLFQRIGKF
ncbi:MAG: ATP-dependent helicase [Candidatus Omnitrophota bacterium]